MKVGAVFAAATSLAAVLVSMSAWQTRGYTRGGAAFAAPPSEAKARAKRADSVITVPLPNREPGQVDFPVSVTLSPNGKWLAVVTTDGLRVRNMTTGRWIRHLGDAYESARWNPSKPILIAPDGSAAKPDFYMVRVPRGKKHQLFRGDPYPFAWTTTGMVWQWGVVDFAKSDVHGAVSHNLGLRIPWEHGIWSPGGPNPMMQHMSPSGPNDELAAEFEFPGKTRGWSAFGTGWRCTEKCRGTGGGRAAAKSLSLRPGIRAIRTG